MTLKDVQNDYICSNFWKTERNHLYRENIQMMFFDYLWVVQAW